MVFALMKLYFLFFSDADAASLRTHIQQNHLSGVSLVCPKCSIQCHSRKDLRNHLKSHKGYLNKIFCSISGQLNFSLKKNKHFLSINLQHLSLVR
jgi:hypothetical protein